MRSRSARLWGAASGGSAVTVVVMIVVLTPDVHRLLGDSEPGWWTDVGTSVFRLLAGTAGAVTAGGALFAAFVVPGPASGIVSPAAYAALRPVRYAAATWAVAAAAMVFFSAAQASGRPVTDAFDPALFPGLVGPAEEPKAWLVTLILAAIAVVTARVLVTWRPAALIALLGVAALLPPVVVGHPEVGAWHDVVTNSVVWHVAAASLWTGSVVALVLWARRGGRDELVLRRQRRLVLACAVVTVLSGGISGYVLTGPDGFASGYGILVLVKLAVAAVVLAIAYWARRRWGTASVVRIAGIELTLLAVTMALAAGLARVPPPTFFSRTPSAQNTILGYELPTPPELSRLLLDWRPDLIFAVIAVLAIAAYLAGVRRLRHRGDTWPTGRVLTWTSGWLLILVSTSSGLAVHAPGSFSLHMIVHMLLNMLAPALLAISGPVTLALRALPATGRDAPAGARAWVVAALHAPATRFLAHPLVAFPVFIGSYYLLYFTGLFPAVMQYHWAHQLMNIHFVVTGYLYYWVVVGIDPAPRPLPHAAKLGMLLAASPFHMYFAILVLNRDSLIGEKFYRYLDLAWQTDALGDQRLGGGIAWGGGELPLLVTVVVLLVQWSRHDDRLARRRGRIALDDDHDALLDALARRVAR